MYRQIWIHEDVRKFQRILWRVNSEVITLQLSTVTFGVASSAYFAIRTIHQLADDEAQNFPNDAVILKQKDYVDDLLTEADSVHEAQNIRTEISGLLKRGGFNIRQWASNNSPILEELPDKDINAKLNLNKESVDIWPKILE